MSATTTPPVSQPAPRGVRWPSRTPSLVAGAAAAWIGGAVAGAVGTGIVVRYLTKTGLTATSVVGLVVLAAGLGGLVHGWRGLWRVVRRWQRLWFAPLTVVTLLTMFSVAQGTMLACSPRTHLGNRTPATFGLAYHDVSFRTEDRVTLSGWLIASANHAAVVTVPGSGSTRTATLGAAAVLARHGYGVLMMDPRGQGHSGGRAMDAGWYGDRDLVAAVAFLRDQPGIDAARVGILGLSMGGEQALGAAPAVHVAAVVAEGATHRTAADKAGYLPDGPAGAVQRVMDSLTYATAALLSPAPEPGTLYGAIARATSTSFLLIAAGKGVDEREAGAYLQRAAPGRVQTWTVPDATHVHGLSTAPAEWTSRVTMFLDRSLLAVYQAGRR